MKMLPLVLGSYGIFIINFWLSANHFLIENPIILNGGTRPLIRENVEHTKIYNKQKIPNDYEE